MKKTCKVTGSTTDVICLSGGGWVKGGRRRQSLVTLTAGAIAAGSEVKTERARRRGRRGTGERGQYSNIKFFLFHYWMLGMNDATNLSSYKAAIENIRWKQSKLY